MPASVGRHGSSASSSVIPQSRPQRLIVGLLILLLVDVIWVASSEFTKYVFTDLNYDKPYFSTYFKTSLFTTYLLGFVVYKPWRDLCGRDAVHFRNSLRRQQGRYRRILQSNDSVDVDSEEREALSTSSGDGIDSEDELGQSSSYGTTSRPRGTIGRSLSSPTLVPVNIPSASSGKSSGTEESDSDFLVAAAAASNSSSVNCKEVDEGDDSGHRRVRFKHLAQVVEMNPAEAIAANLSRLSYNASVRAQSALRRAASRLTVPEVLEISFVFTFLWFAGNYCYQRALSVTEAAVVNILSASSSIFTLLLAGLFPSEPGDKITLSKLFAVGFNFLGVILVSYADIKIERDESALLPTGVIWSLCGAFFYATYIVMLRRKVQSEDIMDPPMFFGFVGMFSTFLLWPGIFVAQAANQEDFEWPTSKQLEFLLLNGFVGTVLSELMWLCGCFYTSSLMATLAIGLTIPLSIIADMVWRQKSYGPVFLVGAIPMFSSFCVVALLTHYQNWDPLMDLFNGVANRCCSVCCFLRPRRNPVPSSSSMTDSLVLNSQEGESLIGASDQDESTNNDRNVADNDQSHL